MSQSTPSVETRFSDHSQGGLSSRDPHLPARCLSATIIVAGMECALVLIIIRCLHLRLSGECAE